MSALISWENLIDVRDSAGNYEATIALVDATGSPEFPLDNMRLRGKARAAQVLGGATFGPVTLLEVDFGGMPKTLNIVAMLGCRKAPSILFLSQFTVRLQVYMGGWVTVAETSFELPFDDAPVDVFFIPVDGQVDTTKFRLVLTEGAPLGFIARLWAGLAILLPDGIDGGWSLGFRDSGVLDTTTGGQCVASPGLVSRVLSIPLEAARTTEMVWGINNATGNALEDDFPGLYPHGAPPSLHRLMAEAGTTGEVIALPRTSTPAWIEKGGVYGHIDQPWAIGHKAGPYWGSTITVVEER